jgi:hypothetical protein
MAAESRASPKSRCGRRPELSSCRPTGPGLPLAPGPRARGLLRGTGTGRGATAPRRRPGLPRQRSLRGCRPALPPKRLLGGAGSLWRNLGPAPSASEGTRRRLSSLRRGRAFLRRRQCDSLAPRLGEPDRDRLLRRTGAVLAFPNVVHLFANEFPGLGRRRFSLSRVLPGRGEGFFVRIGMHVTFRHSVHLEFPGPQESCQLPNAPTASQLDRFPRAFVVLCDGSGGPGRKMKRIPR